MTKIELSGNQHSRWVWQKKKDGYTENNLISTVKYDGGSVILWESLNETLRGCVYPRAAAGLLLDLSAGQLFKHVKIHTKRIQ